MADYFGAAQSLLGGFGSFLGGQATAKGAKEAAKSYAQAARVSLATAGIKAAMVGRQVYQALGGMSAAAGASGLKQSGSVLDLIRDSARQGAITKAVVNMQGEIDFDNYMAQSHTAEQQASAAKTGGTLGMVGGIIGGIGSLFSDDALKQDVELLRRRPDGIGVYRWRYLGSEQFFEGAMASDVEKVRPDAIFMDDSVGLRMVDYDMINMELRLAPN